MPKLNISVAETADAHRSSRRQGILDAAGRVFMDKGFANATTLEIASTAGVSKRDLYAAFPSKDALLRALIQSRVEVMSAPITLAAPKSTAAVYATLHGFGGAFLATLLSPGTCALYRLAIANAQTEVASDAPSIGTVLLASGIANTTGRLDAFMAKAEADGHIRLTDCEAAVRAFFGVLIGNLLMRQLLDPSARVTPAEIDRNVERAIAALRSFVLVR
jgi:TetR/AcrR family transcriptional regulator, mexJK operon transcriptional repressor